MYIAPLFFKELLLYLKDLTRIFYSFPFIVLGVLFLAFYLIKPFTSFIERANLMWFILFLVAWGLFFKVSNLEHLKKNYLGGLVTLVMGTLLEVFFINKHFWRDITGFEIFGEMPVFLALGPYTVVGLLFFQYLPEEGFKRYFFIAYWALFSTMVELIFVKIGAIIYDDWTWAHSLLAYSLSYLAVTGFYSCLGHAVTKVGQYGQRHQDEKAMDTMGGFHSNLDKFLRHTPLAFLTSIPVIRKINRMFTDFPKLNKRNP